MKILRHIRQWLAMADRVRQLEAELITAKATAAALRDEIAALKPERRASRNCIEKVRQALAQHEKEVG